MGQLAVAGRLPASGPSTCSAVLREHSSYIVMLKIYNGLYEDYGKLYSGLYIFHIYVYIRLKMNISCRKVSGGEKSDTKHLRDKQNVGASWDIRRW